MRTGLIATLFGALALAACGSAGSSTWQKPIELSPQVQAYFDAYTELPAPGVFVVSEDGRQAGYTYCPAVSGSACRTSRTYTIIRNCESRSGGVECKIYAIGVSQVFSGQ